MKDNIAKVTEILRSYRSKKRMIEQLKFELQNPSQITAAELLRTMAIGSSEFSTVHGSGGVSDKTMSVVAHYGEIADRMNMESLDEIKRELRALVNETTKIEVYVGLLDSNSERIIRLRDFEGKSWSDMESEINATERRLREQRKAAIAELASMYRFVDTLIDKNEKEAE